MNLFQENLFKLTQEQLDIIDDIKNEIKHDIVKENSMMLEFIIVWYCIANIWKIDIAKSKLKDYYNMLKELW